MICKNKTLGENLRNIRRNKKFSLSDLSLLTGFPIYYLEDIENTSYLPSEAELTMISDALHLGYVDLMDLIKISEMTPINDLKD